RRSSLRRGRRSPAGVVASPSGSPAPAPSTDSSINESTAARRSARSTSRPSSTATPRLRASPSRPSSRCSVPTQPWPRSMAASRARVSARRSLPVKGPRPAKAAEALPLVASVTAITRRTASSRACWHTAETGTLAWRTASARSSGRYTLILGTEPPFLRALGLYWGYTTTGPGRQGATEPERAPKQGRPGQGRQSREPERRELSEAGSGGDLGDPAPGLGPGPHPDHLVDGV